MATCKENCIHYSVCGLWDRKVFVDYDNNILSDFSDLPNVEEHCRNYLSKQVEAEWKPIKQYSERWGVETINYYRCSNCDNLQYTYNQNYCSKCGARMVERR